MKKTWQIPLTITFILLGILLSTQLQTQNRLASDLSQQSISELTIMVKNLTEKRQSLALEINELQKNIEAHSDDAELSVQLESEIEKLDLILGKTPVQGPGIIVTISKDSWATFFDLARTINELWAAGAEAIAINEQRITFSSNFSYADLAQGQYLVHNKQLLKYPIVIEAIGNAATLDTALTMPGGIIDTQLSIMGVAPSVVQMDNIILPAAK